MGIAPIGDGPKNDEFKTGHWTSATGGDAVPLLRIQAIFGVCGSLLGGLGVLLPHPDTFMVPELLLLNALTMAASLGVWFFADRIPPVSVRYLSASGTILITVAVILSRDSTSAYALLYLFPAIYAYYFLRRLDAVMHIVLAIAMYGVAIAVISMLPEPENAPVSGSIFHHFVITAGSLVVIGVMLVYLRSRVEQLMDQVVESARTDLLTGLLNTRSISELLYAEIDRSRMGGSRVTVLHVTVGGMRDVSNRHGHGAAEDLIKQFGLLLNESTRRIDPVGRTGNAEFTVILPETEENTAFLLGEQLLARARRTFRERGVTLTASIGIACYPKHSATAEGLLQAAATASEAARALGSDRAVVYSVELEDVLAGDVSRGLTETRTHLSTVLSLAEVLDLRDARTASHSLAVARYCEMLGAQLGLDEHRVQRLRLAGMLHDIGKVGIPDSILDKPGPLSPTEWDEVRKHPEMAARILGARELSDIREWILCRHEQLDGHGYPQGLAASAIPIESRILAVAESYDAMTSERPYRSALTREEAIVELGRYVGSQFDGKVVDAMLRVLDGSAHQSGMAQLGH